MIIDQNLIKVVRGTSCEITINIYDTTGLDDFTPYLTVKGHHASTKKLIDLEATTFDLGAKKIVFNVPYKNNILPVGRYYFDVNLEHIYSLLEIDVTPTDDWEPGDIIEGQTSGATCIIISKISSTKYKIKDIIGTFSDGEAIGVTGESDKLANQGAGYPSLTKIPIDGMYKIYPVTSGIYKITKSIRY